MLFKKNLTLIRNDSNVNAAAVGIGGDEFIYLRAELSSQWKIVATNKNHANKTSTVTKETNGVEDDDDDDNSDNSTGINDDIDGKKYVVHEMVIELCCGV